jgi:hypothetical protein
VKITREESKETRLRQVLEPVVITVLPENEVFGSAGGDEVWDIKLRRRAMIYSQ